MATLYIRNVPPAVTDGLERLASREGLSVSGFVLRELAEVARRADNAALLGGLPSVATDPDVIVADVVEGRAAR